MTCQPGWSCMVGSGVHMQCVGYIHIWEEAACPPQQTLAYVSSNDSLQVELDATVVVPTREMV